VEVRTPGGRPPAADSFHELYAIDVADSGCSFAAKTPCTWEIVEICPTYEDDKAVLIVTTAARYRPETGEGVGSPLHRIRRLPQTDYINIGPGALDCKVGNTSRVHTVEVQAVSS
jgi:hypothetical protein